MSRGAVRVWVVSDEPDDAGHLIADVTEGVQVLYDEMVGSMLWTSNFLSNEEAMQILQLAQRCGFLADEEVKAKFEEYARGNGEATCAQCGGLIAWRGVYQPREDPRWRHWDRTPPDRTAGYRGVEVAADHEARLW